jgi:hypothetical protein
MVHNRSRCEPPRRKTASLLFVHVSGNFEGIRETSFCTSFYSKCDCRSTAARAALYLRRSFFTLVLFNKGKSFSDS